MAKKKTQIPKYGTITLKGIQYYRTRITDADGKELSLYAATCEELYEKQLEARKQVEEIIFHRQHPTVGLLVCKSKDDIKAQYALEASSQPLGVSAYELSKLIPENFKGSLPSIDEIESELRKDTEG